ncbi:MAG: ABC transporter permease [Rhodobacteraceae bacterium]|jgi:putative spermidine/putrescine transport system permease protein|nr:ABC transporter permease [Paracoccaceae bacterium]MBL4557184.1 ABC transporter permease [Paracoccaceae bacterium]HBG98375.1 ABC transporter permease [Paracoccaceae bacterium]
MTDAAIDGPVLSADGRPLKQSLRRSLRRQQWRAILLIAPLFVFVLVSFLMPIGSMLFRSVENDIVPDTLPLTVAALQDWDYASGEPPGEPVYAAMAADLQAAFEEKTHTQVGRRLNYETPGVSSIFRKSGRPVSRWDLAEDGPFRDRFIDIDADWGDPEVWRTIKSYGGRYTTGYYLAAIDGELTPEGPRLKEPDQRVNQKLLWRTLWLSAFITFCTFALGYPVAWLMANIRERTANLLLILVLLPFWTSLLVRTSSWKILLQEQGVINDFAVWIGLVADDNRFQMINNQFGVVVAMTHILLPFMILPLYSVMKTISPTYVRAARSLGATSWTSFWRVYFPQSVPGIGAGAILVFILAVGYFITPELVGGADGTFISNRIYYQFSVSGNWGLAAALGTMMLAVVLVLFWVYDKIVGVDNMKLG